MCSNENEIHLLNLPDLVIERIFYYLSFDEIAENRVVCTRFDQIGKACLNKGLFAAIRYNDACTEEITSKLAQRESKRRNSWLARNKSTLENLKFMYMDFPCGPRFFIPGMILDEYARIMRIIMNRPENLIDSDLLSDFYDMSSTAISHQAEMAGEALARRVLSGFRPRHNSTGFVPSKRQRTE